MLAQRATLCSAQRPGTASSRTELSLESAHSHRVQSNEALGHSITY
jgi:hypothetical protein